MILIELWVFLARNMDTGDEQVMATFINGRFLPLIASSMQVAVEYKKIATDIRKQTGKPFIIKHFTFNREVPKDEIVTSPEIIQLVK